MRSARIAYFTCLALFASPIPAQAPQTGQPDWLFIARARSQQEGIPLGEAVRRIKMQDRIVALQERLLERYPEDFGGIVINSSQSRYGYRALFKRGGQGRLAQASGDAELAGAGTEAEAARSLQELAAAHQSVVGKLKAAGIPAGVGIDIEANGLELITPDPARVAALNLPDFVRIEKGSPGITFQAAIRGGRPVEGTLPNGNAGACTTGFAVLDYTGRRGITAAGHCPEDLEELSGASLGPRIAEVVTLTTGKDLQWHSSTSNTYPNEISAGPNIVKITNVLGRSLMYPAQTQVCIVRRTGDVPCGTIYSINYVDTASGHGPFVGVRPPTTLVMTYSGDSGGPWFYGNNAFGSHVGLSGEGISMFMAADQFSALSIYVAKN
ncbi:MAG TPA: hypothetical protein VFZ91_13285 [Allosphingosinicella sp.]